MATAKTSSKGTPRWVKKEHDESRKPHFSAGAAAKDAPSMARVRPAKPEPHHRYTKGYKKSTRKSHAHSEKKSG